MNVRAAERSLGIGQKTRVSAGAGDPAPGVTRDRLELSRPRRDGRAPARGRLPWKGIGILACGVASLAGGILLMPINPAAGAAFCFMGGSVIYNGVRTLSRRR